MPERLRLVVHRVVDVPERRDLVDGLVLPEIGVELSLVAGERVAGVGGLEELAAQLVSGDLLRHVEERLGALVVAQWLASLVDPGDGAQDRAVDAVRRRTVEVEADVAVLLAGLER